LYDSCGAPVRRRKKREEGGKNGRREWTGARPSFLSPPLRRSIGGREGRGRRRPPHVKKKKVAALITASFLDFPSVDCRKEKGRGGGGSKRPLGPARSKKGGKGGGEPYGGGGGAGFCAADSFDLHQDYAIENREGGGEGGRGEKKEGTGAALQLCLLCFQHKEKGERGGGEPKERKTAEKNGKRGGGGGDSFYEGVAHSFFLFLRPGSSG